MSALDVGLGAPIRAWVADEIETLKMAIFAGLSVPTKGCPWWAGDRFELQWRLNERLQGRDPGQPVTWKGLS